MGLAQSIPFGSATPPPNASTGAGTPMSSKMDSVLDVLPESKAMTLGPTPPKPGASAAMPPPAKTPPASTPPTSDRPAKSKFVPPADNKKKANPFDANYDTIAMMPDVDWAKKEKPATTSAPRVVKTPK